MEKIFQNGSKHDSREILIKIDDNCIAFYFYDQYKRQNEWMLAETERRKDFGEDELTEDEKANREFYWIEIEQWKKDMNNWHEHMKEKSWFTRDMGKFMDENSKTM